MPKITKKSFAVSLMIFLAILITLFLVLFETNLHCDQYTSFKIAVFELEPHPEECGRQSCPLIYQESWQIPLRVFFTITLLLFLFYPIISNILQINKKITTRTFYISNLYIFVAFIINIYLSYILAGERFFWLNLSSLLVGILSFFMIMLVDLFTRGKDQGN